MTEFAATRRKRPSQSGRSLYLPLQRIGPIITPFILQADSTSAPLVAYAERMSPFDHLLFFLFGGLCVYGAVALLQLQKMAMYLLPIGGAGRIALNLWAFFTKYDVEPTPSLVWGFLSVGLLVG
jgi:hypothetical protein